MISKFKIRKLTVTDQHNTAPTCTFSAEISHQITSRYSDPVECLSAHLLFECSEVVAGVKPANLVSLTKRTRPCGRNLYDLWHSHHDKLSTRIDDVCFRVLKTRDRSLLLFCYNPDLLSAHLNHFGLRRLLGKAGYDATLSGEDLLDELCCRIKNSDVFPHEIGLFIGYPAKDVAAFMGMVTLPFARQGLWKIYGNPDKSLKLADRFKTCRSVMAYLLNDHHSPPGRFPEISRNSFYLPVN